MRLYCIYDKVAQEGGPLFEAKNDTVALRIVSGISLPSPREDYKVFCVGEYSHDPVKLTALKEITEVLDVSKEVEDDA